MTRRERLASNAGLLVAQAMVLVFWLGLVALPIILAVRGLQAL